MGPLGGGQEALKTSWLGGQRVKTAKGVQGAEAGGVRGKGPAPASSLAHTHAAFGVPPDSARGLFFASLASCKRVLRLGEKRGVPGGLCAGGGWVLLHLIKEN